MFGNATAPDDASLLSEELERTPDGAASCVKQYVDDCLRKSDNGKMDMYHSAKILPLTNGMGTVHHLSPR